MAKGKVSIDIERCKGCGLCVNVCPKNVLAFDESYINLKGVHPAYMAIPENCIGCASCAVMCPDVAITVFREVKEA